MSPSALQWLPVLPLTAPAFAPFGRVIECDALAQQISINAGTCTRFHDLARPHIEGGAVAMSIFAAQAAPMPAALRLMERHPLGTQAFVPMGRALRMLLVVADGRLAPEALRPHHLHAFVTTPEQAVQLHTGTWHHPLLALDSGNWLVVDRVGAGHNCDEVEIGHWQLRCEV